MAEDLLYLGGVAVGEVRGISEAEFDEIVRLNQRRIYRVLLALVRDPELADILTQECFLRAYQKRATFRGEASVSTWLTRIAINLARDHGRNRRESFWRKVFGSGTDEAELHARQVPDARSSPEQQLLAREAVKAVMAAVEKLTPQQREIFVLRFLEEMSLEEIARVRQRDVGTIKAHLFRAVQQVRKALKQEGKCI
jgi:RNA polymerase sigma-70 factor (ECF subfamily)